MPESSSRRLCHLQDLHAYRERPGFLHDCTTLRGNTLSICNLLGMHISNCPDLNSMQSLPLSGDQSVCMLVFSHLIIAILSHSEA